MNWYEVYPIVATEISDTISDRPNDVTHVYNALLGLAALSTSEGSEQQDSEIKATVSLMPPMHTFYNYAVARPFYSQQRLIMVYEINTFTTYYFGNLTNFVNGLNWPDECIPYYWAQLSDEAGFDTNSWVICS